MTTPGDIACAGGDRDVPVGRRLFGTIAAVNRPHPSRWPRVAIAIVGLAGLVLTGCAPRIPAGALAMRPQTLEHRRLSTRLFGTHDEGRILVACAGVLQDLGFTLDDSETKLGLIVASKDRIAVEAGQVTRKIIVGILFRANTPIDERQRFRASIVTHPAGARTAVRVTFQRIVWNDRGQVSRLERIEDPEVYQTFFERLSKAVFLEAQGI